MDNEQQNQQSPFSQYSPSEGQLGETHREDGPLKHSKLGVASFIISLASLLLIVIAIILAVSSVAQLASDEDFISKMEEMRSSFEMDPTGASSEFGSSDELASNFIPLIIGVVLLFGSVGIALVGLILGIIGVAMKNRRKVFGIIGLILNGLIVLGAIGFFVIGIIGSLSLAP